MRFAHTQVCPVFRYFEARAPSTAASRSASSNTMNGALPPSSIDAFFTVFEHCSRSTLPTWVEPVKVILRTIGLEVISPPIAEELPVSTLSTPLGMPARSPSSAIASAEYGVAVAGFPPLGQPGAGPGAPLPRVLAVGEIPR